MTVDNALKANLNIEETFCDQVSAADLLNSLDSFISKIDDGMLTWLEKFKWDKRTLLQKFQNSGDNNCFNNSANKNIKHINLNRHIEACQLKGSHFNINDSHDYYKISIEDNNGENLNNLTSSENAGLRQCDMVIDGLRFETKQPFFDSNEQDSSVHRGIDSLLYILVNKNCLKLGL